ncbi:MAG: aminopeptidase P family N-terminal domain-containing protein, partial [Phycisphaeraceae bacterium]|nr:aminopeptidase P family N-terminal domain-containing protein [Phycisphaeraceae bacterium]
MQLFDQARAVRAMETHGIDVILATTRTNVGYLADYYGHYIAQQPFYLEDGGHYDIIAGLPRDPDQGAFLTPCTGEEGELSAGICWIEDLRYCGPELVVQGSDGATTINTDPAKAAAEALADRRLDAATIGVEMNDIPVKLFERLRRHLPKARFVDAEPVLWQMKVVKTPEEVRRLREAVRATESAIAYAFDRLHAGMSELTFERNVYVKLAECGADR